jgi:hypothetical protein
VQRLIVTTSSTWQLTQKTKKSNEQWEWKAAGCHAHAMHAARC